MHTITKAEESRIKSYLGRKLSEGNLILFTGAGFSSGAKDRQGKTLPTSHELAKEIAQRIEMPYSREDSLKEVYQVAMRKKKNKVSLYLKERFAVNPETLKEEYKVIINQPWKKVYTINIDSLFTSAQVKFKFDRKVTCVSNNIRNQGHISKNLIVTYLHGMLEDIPDGVTFSQEQYSEKTANLDAYYINLASEVLQFPFVFIGSKLDEQALWHYIQLRKKRGMNNENRPKSLIVTPELSQFKIELLKEYNIIWVPHTWEQFCEKFLIPLEVETKKGFIKLKQSVSESVVKTVPVVSDLITRNQSSRTIPYLLGAEPSWKDVYSNTVIERDKEKEWIKTIKESVKTKQKNSTPIFIFTGTAGDGKTSFAMRIALYFSNKGQTIGWIDRDSEISPHKIDDLVSNTENLESLFIDTPERYGREFAQIISSLALSKKLKFIALVPRNTKVDQIIESPLFDQSVYTKEFNTYRLTDNEINKLLDLLEEKNLIGALKNIKRNQQVELFKNKYKKQLIVAMIEVTSGKSFTEKICEEFEKLPANDRYIYCLVALATAKFSSLSKGEILIGMGEGRDNGTVNIINKLVKRGLFIEDRDRLKVRHGVIAEKIIERLYSDGHLMMYYERLVYIVAVKSDELGSEKGRMKRLLKKLINHEALFKISSEISEAQKLYESVADLLGRNHQFWLQRGCFELEHGNLDLARNYLNQSSGLNSSDPLVKLSLAHLSFKEAIANPNTEQAHQSAKGAYDGIIQLINERGKKDPYPYHVLGTQGLRWAKTGIKNDESRKDYLENLWDIMKKGVKAHPRLDKLKNLRQKLHEEVLNFSLRN